jgi:hypothetical protein
MAYLKYYSEIRLQLRTILDKEHQRNRIINIMKRSVRDNQPKFETGLTQV